MVGAGKGVVTRRELKDLYLVRGIGLIMTMYRAESEIFLWMLWRCMEDWSYNPTHSYLGMKRRRTVSIAPDQWQKEFQNEKSIVMTWKWKFWDSLWKKVGTGSGRNWLTVKYLCLARLASALFLNDP